MFMPMLAPAAGTLRWRLPEGSILAPGDLIATLDLTDPRAVTQAVPFTGAHWGSSICCSRATAPASAGLCWRTHGTADISHWSTIEKEQLPYEACLDPSLWQQQIRRALSW
jgi:hypothetical protein